MTAFASCERTVAEGTLRWELKSVNHRYLAVNPRLPESLRALEPTLRERIDAALGRGKIDAVLSYWPAATSEVAIDWAYVDELIAASRALAARQGDAAPVSPLEVLRMPGVMREVAPDADALGEAALSLFDEALAELVAAREREGERLAAIIRERVANVGELISAVRQRRGSVVAEMRERMQARLASLDIEADPTRLEQELAMAAQRLDVDEELSRLASHCEAVSDSLDAGEPIGRRLDFLMQELNREANTLSSKSGDTETTRCAVDMKVCIEQMREQVQNIE
jgi:uncharacterized protein (TIGR00255 family)